MHTDTANKRTIFGSVIVAAGIFAVDLMLPPGVAAGALYVVLVVLSLWSPQRGFTVFVAAVGTGLTILAYCLKPPSGTFWMMLTNSFLSIAVIWVTAVVVLQRKRAFLELDHFFDLSEDMLCIVGLDGSFKRLNPAFEKTLGYTASELVGQPWVGFVHPEEQAETLAALEKPSTGVATRSHENRYRCKDGSSRWLAWHCVPVVPEGVVYAMARDVTEQRQTEAALRRSQEELRALTANLLCVQEEERRRVSRELHDNLNQELALLGIEVAKLDRQLSSSPDLIRRQLRVLQEQLEKVADNVRRIAYQLHPAILDYLGLAAALESECSCFSERQGIEVKFTHQNLPDSLPEDLSLCLYRVAQECLRNIAKHANAAFVTVGLEGHHNGIRLCVEDFGIAFDPERVKGKRRLGLVSMEERVRLINGVLSITSRPRRGAQVAVWVPLVGKEVSNEEAAGVAR